MLINSSVTTDSIATDRPRLLLLAFSCDPDETMEDRNGWHRAIQAAEDFDVTVLTAPTAKIHRLMQSVPQRLKQHIRFVAVPVSDFALFCFTSERCFYIAYRHWQKSALRVAMEMHRENRFDVSHLVSICGYREPGYLWQLDCPFILGPVGGTSSFPLRYLSMVDSVAGIFEVCRNIVNAYQLRWSPRIARAVRGSAMVIAANQSTQRDLQRIALRPVELELETGIDYPIDGPKPIREPNEPLRILWAGRLRAWKGLPILLHAIAQLPSETAVHVRIVGDGCCKARWQRLATRLGIESRVEWIERPPYRQSLQHYRWADLYAFTSMRDTSGTGLLESLAAGTPILGLNHQGAADIMTSQCAVAVSLASPNRTIQAFRDAIVALASDSDRLKQLSDGALLRAKHYDWSNRYSQMRERYLTLIEHSQPGQTQSTISNQHQPRSQHQPTNPMAMAINSSIGSVIQE